MATARKFWSWTWPKLLAVAIVIGFWQLLVWIEWKPLFVLPSPATVFAELGDLVTTQRFWEQSPPHFDARPSATARPS